MLGDSLTDVIIVDIASVGIQGPPGPLGPIGPQGPQGPPGGASGFPPTPVDSNIYGIQGTTTTWQAALPLTGGTVTGPTTFSGTGIALDVGTGTARFRNPALTAPVLITRNTGAPSGYMSGTQLEILGADGSSPVLSIESFGASFPFLSFRAAQGTAVAPTAQISGARLGVINFQGHDGTAFTTAQAYHAVVCEANWSPTSRPTYYQWYTTPVNSTTMVERMRLDSAGELLLGGVTTSNGYKLKVHQGTVAPGAPASNIFSEIDFIAGSTASPTFANQFTIVNDNATSSSTTLFNLSYNFGGPAHTGAVSAFTTGVSMTSATAPAAARYYIGNNIFMTSSYSCGGTDTGGINSRGNWYALNVTPQLLSGATNWMELTSAEIDSAVAVGASVSRRVNLKLCLQNNHGVQGTMSDCMLEIAAIKGSTVGSLFGVLFGAIEGLFPLDNTNGVAIGHVYCGGASVPTAGVNPQLKTFIDVSHIRALTAHWLSPGASLDGSGNWTVGPAKLGWSAAGASLDVFGQVGGTPIVTAGGSQALNNQIVTTGNGDLYTATVVGGAITALTVIVPATSRTTGPVGAQIIQGDGVTGAQCTIPWTNARTLALQPGGGAITSPLLVNAANDAAAASAGVAVQQWYRNGSAIMQRVV